MSIKAYTSNFSTNITFEFYSTINIQPKSLQKATNCTSKDTRPSGNSHPAAPPRRDSQA